MSRPTKVTITSMMAESGSRTQPRSTCWVPTVEPGEVDRLANGLAVGPAGYDVGEGDERQKQ